jgi:hypothetical protein
MALANEIIDQSIRRLNELSITAPVHWTRPELLTFLNDGISELNLLSQDHQLTVPVTVDNTAVVWDLPSGVIAPLSARLGTICLVREPIEDLDKEAKWEDPSLAQRAPKIWCPLGLYKMVVYPRSPSTKTINVEVLAEHTAVTDAAVALPIRPEYERALEDYMVSRAMFKEGGAEFQQGVTYYNRFLDAVQQLSGRNILRAYPQWDVKETKISETTLREGAELPGGGK